MPLLLTAGKLYALKQFRSIMQLGLQIVRLLHGIVVMSLLCSCQEAYLKQSRCLGPDEGILDTLHSKVL